MALVKPLGELARRLIRRAGYNPDQEGMWKGGQYGEEFYEILQALNYIGNRKVEDYGDFRLQEIRSWDRETWGAYWDIQRKFGRLETQLHRGTDFLRAASGIHDTTSDTFVTSARTKVIEDLMESLSDQAVYCVRMIQILRRLEEKGMVPLEYSRNRS